MKFNFFFPCAYTSKEILKNLRRSRRNCSTLLLQIVEKPAIKRHLSAALNCVLILMQMLRDIFQQK